MFRLKLSPVKKSETLNTSTSVSGDYPTKIIKLSKFVCATLTASFNQSLTSRKFSDSLKRADVTPVHKKHYKHDKNNYRPVIFSPSRLDYSKN